MPHATSLADMSNPAWMAEKAGGIAVGNIIYEKAVGPDKGLYKVIEITATIVKADDWNLGQPSTLTCNIRLANIAKWAVFKADPPMVITDSLECIGPCNVKHMAIDLAR